ncbi:DUF975 family protein [Clostridium niameyense]|uniref:DUF975 family protein n=1 Tax=Clostridium niameyense TaxID=1622073 RepID=A0A6M0RBT7_9CLOT|nr:DUF975 family protein [Clostridium niameyense]NEZ47771.1 DUF975 family protein [Clostridium niameyense]
MEDTNVLSNSEIKSKAKKALNGNWIVAVITFIIYNIITNSISIGYNVYKFKNFSAVNENTDLGITITIFIAALILKGPMTYGLRRFFINLVRNENYKIENIFEGFKYFGGTFIINIVLFIYGFLISLAIFIPFIIIIVATSITSFSLHGLATNNMFLTAFVIILVISMYLIITIILLRYSMTYYIYIDNPEIGAMKAIKESVLMMDGNKTKLLLLYLSFILWYILGIFTLGIGFLWIFPYINTSIAIFYDEIKNSKLNDDSKEIEII